MASEAKFSIIIGGNADELAKVLKTAQRELTTFGKDLEKLGASLTAKVTAPLVGFGAAAIAAANTIDDAMDKVRAGTGATGAALVALEKDFRQVFRGVPEAAGDVASVIADLNTRLGLTGDPLRELSTQMLNLARITGEDVRGVVQATTRVFGDWSVATEQQSTALDFLFKTSQATGIGVTRLSQLVVQFGAPLRQFGIGFEEAAALMGKWEKEGVNTELVMGLLRVALGEMAERGVTDFAGGLRTAIQAIQDAKTNTEATGIAFEIFGRRAGADMAAAIREGRFAVTDLLAKLRGSSETINKASEDTKGFGEQWGILRNRIVEAIEPLGKELVQAFSTHVFPMLTKGIDQVRELGKWFAALPEPVRNASIAFGTFAAAVGPALVGLGLMIRTLAPLVALGPMGLAALAIVLTGAATAMVLFGTGTKDTAAEVERLNKLNPGLGDSFKTIAEQLERTADPKKRAELQKVLDAMREFGPEAMSVAGKIELGKLAMDAFGKSAAGAGKASGALGEQSHDAGAHLNAFRAVSERIREVALDKVLEAQREEMSRTTEHLRTVGLNALAKYAGETDGLTRRVAAHAAAQRVIEEQFEETSRAVVQQARAVQMLEANTLHTTVSTTSAWRASFAAFKDGFTGAVDKGFELMSSMTAFGVATAHAMQRGFSDFFFTALRFEFKSLGDVVVQFKDAMLRAFADILGAAVTKGLVNLVGGLLGGGGPVQLAGPRAHGGGVLETIIGGIGRFFGAGDGTTNGTSAGLGPNEVVSILEKGEAVFSAETWTKLKDLVGLGEGPSAFSKIGDLGGAAMNWVSANPGMAAGGAAALLGLGLQFAGGDAAKAGQVIGALAPFLGVGTSAAIGAISGATGA
ncbi:MAG: phage tail tape measure protein, partial [Candidatus Rokubacteria bacterium]|nr:phage tail tape measure protein [Candidatus Rokubacteria bacterium]